MCKAVRQCFKPPFSTSGNRFLGLKKCLQAINCINKDSSSSRARAPAEIWDFANRVHAALAVFSHLLHFSPALQKHISGVSKSCFFCSFFDIVGTVIVVFQCNCDFPDFLTVCIALGRQKIRQKKKDCNFDELKSLKTNLALNIKC